MNAWTEIPSCGSASTTIGKAQTLYYIATAGQTAFPLTTTDMFGNNSLITDSTPIAVSRNGARLAPDDGTGRGGYTVNVAGNEVDLVWPAGVGEIVIIDIFEAIVPGVGPPGPTGPAGPAGPNAVSLDAGNMAVLGFDGLVFVSLVLNVASVLNAVNDAAAATAGVPIGGIYRNGSILMVRVV